MSSAVLFTIALTLFFFAYRFYSGHLSSRLFNLVDLDHQNKPTPAVEFEDGIDYVPAKKGVILGHHFSSIAGAAPIVGLRLRVSGAGGDSSLDYCWCHFYGGRS